MSDEARLNCDQPDDGVGPKEYRKSPAPTNPPRATPGKIGNRRHERRESSPSMSPNSGCRHQPTPPRTGRCGVEPEPVLDNQKRGSRTDGHQQPVSAAAVRRRGALPAGRCPNVGRGPRPGAGGGDVQSRRAISGGRPESSPSGARTRTASPARQTEPARRPHADWSCSGGARRRYGRGSSRTSAGS